MNLRGTTSGICMELQVEVLSEFFYLDKDR